MKNIKILILIFVCLFIVNVKADMGAPSVVSHKVKVTNKSGAACYSNGKKTGKVIPYGTTFELFSDIDGSYVYVSVNEYNCDIKYSDISAVNQNFNVSNEDKLNPAKKAIVLAKGGLNMRKGPAVTYGRITTIPQNSVITLTHYAGTFWYYTNYNGKTGWVTGMDGYLGFEGKDVLISHKAIKIYSSNGKTVLATIPANTEIEEYIELSGTPYSNFYYYVIYNGTKGYLQEMMGQKTDGKGKIKLTKDYTLYDENGNPTKKITAGQEFEYSIIYDSTSFYIPSRNEVLYLVGDQFEYVKEAKVVTKTKGYLGEGLFGEEKTKKDEPEVVPEEEKEDEPKVEPKTEKTDVTTIIIIALLAGIFACLTALVIIKLVNSKKKAPVVKEAKKEEVKEEKELPKEEPEIKVSDKEILKAREEIAKEVNSTEEENKNKEV